jgi:hypothetical protein
VAILLKDTILLFFFVLLTFNYGHSEEWDAQVVVEENSVPPIYLEETPPATKKYSLVTICKNVPDGNYVCEEL